MTISPTSPSRSESCSNCARGLFRDQKPARHAELRLPTDLPATASVYVCDRGAIGPGATEALTFEVVKNTALTFDDDLTFRADVIGEITLSDATPLWFPAPLPRAAATGPPPARIERRR
jgi:hypothetical protein